MKQYVVHMKTEIIQERSGTGNMKCRHYSAADHTFAILAYEESPYLEECIRSIMTQSEKGEMIICTSTLNDHIYGIAGKYDIPIRINEESKGIGSDWNYAYDQAETRLVTLAHQDDIYERKFLERTLEGINTADTPLISFTDYYEIQKERIATYKNFTNLRIKKTMLTPLRSKSLRATKWLKRFILSFVFPSTCVFNSCHNLGQFTPCQKECPCARERGAEKEYGSSEACY